MPDRVNRGPRVSLMSGNDDFSGRVAARAGARGGENRSPCLPWQSPAAAAATARAGSSVLPPREPISVKIARSLSQPNLRPS